MSLIIWSLLGLVCGYLANRFVSTAGSGILTDVGLGVGGAIMAGAIVNAIGQGDVSEMSLYNVVVPLIGSAAVLFVYHFFNGRAFGKR